MAPMSRVCFSTGVLADLAEGVRMADGREAGGVGGAGKVGCAGVAGGGRADEADEADWAYTCFLAASTPRRTLAFLAMILWIRFSTSGFGFQPSGLMLGMMWGH